MLPVWEAIRAMALAASRAEPPPNPTTMSQASRRRNAAPWWISTSVGCGPIPVKVTHGIPASARTPVTVAKSGSSVTSGSVTSSTRLP